MTSAVVHLQSRSRPAPTLPRFLCLGVNCLAAALTVDENADYAIRAFGGDSGPVWQELHNRKDMMYVADMELGGQSMTGLLDTGSFEMLVFGRACAQCGTAALYDSNLSSSFLAGGHREDQSYGSGGCVARDARDTLHVGPFAAPSQSFWEALRCNMDILEDARFNAVVGVGPPGEPEYTARQSLDRVLRIEKRLVESGKPVTPAVHDAKKRWQHRISEAQGNTALLDSFEVKTFSTCLGRSAGSPGWFVWRDRRPDVHVSPQVIEVAVPGNVNWALQMTDLFLEDDVLHKKLSLGCEKGCGAILDTGSSFFGVPTKVYMMMMRRLSWRLQECHDLRHFPDLVLHFGGREVRFPPESYVGKVDMSQNFSARVGDFLHLKPVRQHDNDGEDSLDDEAVSDDDVIKGGSDAIAGDENFTESRVRHRRSSVFGGKASHIAAEDAECQLLLLDMGDEKTQLGPMYVLGMPFFREYYTTFDLGTGRGDRRIYMQPVGEDCRASDGGDVQVGRRKGEAMHVGGHDRRARIPRRVDLSAARIPIWLDASRRSPLATLDSDDPDVLEL